MGWKIDGCSGGGGLAVRGLGLPEEQERNDGDTITGQEISLGYERLKKKGGGYDNGRSRCWVNHKIEDISKERVHNKGS